MRVYTKPHKTRVRVLKKNYKIVPTHTHNSTLKYSLLLFQVQRNVQ